jgi:3-hydroxybutyryl-CoA dehydrogenase
MQIEKVGVVGCGLMGAGIAEICAKSGYETIVREVNDELLTKGLDRIGRSLDKAVSKGKLEGAEKEEALGRLTGTTDLEDLADCDLVVEAIIESLEHKCELYAALDGIVKKSGVFASNTSSLTITEMAMATKRTERFLGLHFFNPVPIMKLVEVVRTIMTDDQVFEETKEFIRSLGKEPVSCQDNSGFIVNRLLVPYLLDAIRGLEEGIGTVEDIDKAMQLQGHAAGLRLPDGAAHPARLCRLGHHLLHRQHHVRGVQGEAVCAAPAAQTDGACRSAGTQERPRILRLFK